MSPNDSPHIGPKLPLRFVFDASALIAEGHGDSDALNFFLFSSRLVGHQVCLPPHVLDEVLSHYKRTLTDKVNAAKSSFAKAAKLMPDKPHPPFPAIVIDDALAKKTTLLRERLDGASCTTLPYPVTSHEYLAQRAISRKRPFDTSGSGYRDALIWESILMLVSDCPGDVVFITADKDFADADGALHTDLKQDLESKAYPGNKVVLVKDIARAIDQFIRPELTRINTIDRAATSMGPDPSSHLAHSIEQEYVQSRTWRPDELGLPWHFEDISIESVVGVSAIRAIDTRELDDGQLLVKINAVLDCVLDVHVQRSEVHALEELDITENWNRQYVRGEIRRSIHSTMAVAVGQSDRGAPEVQVLSLERHGVSV